MKVTSETSPFAMYSFICEVVISSYSPLVAKYCRARSTPTTASRLHSHGPLNMRFTGFSRTGYGAAWPPGSPEAMQAHD